MENWKRILEAMSIPSNPLLASGFEGVDFSMAGDAFCLSIRLDRPEVVRLGTQWAPDVEIPWRGAFEAANQINEENGPATVLVGDGLWPGEDGPKYVDEMGVVVSLVTLDSIPSQRLLEWAVAEARRVRDDFRHRTFLDFAGNIPGAEA